MTRRKKSLLWTDGTLLVLLVLFASDSALVLPVRPYREYWGIAWPPFFSDNYLKIPDWGEEACFIGILITGAVLIGFGLLAAWNVSKGRSHQGRAARG
ncbi:MAG TPA: hypothetical protein VGT03_16615 [Candidatus Acidoferrales bacterium]|nr:hypothetical protein [Candidatus Acidoferrales bacterium]